MDDNAHHLIIDLWGHLKERGVVTLRDEWRENPGLKRMGESTGKDPVGGEIAILASQALKEPDALP